MPVASETAIPASASMSITRSIQPKSYSPGRGSTVAHEKIPSVTIVTPASFISRRSSSQTAGSHCSGL